MRVLNISEKLSVDGGGVARRIRDFAPHVANQGVDVYFAGSESSIASYPGMQQAYYCPELEDNGLNSDGMSLLDIVSSADIDVVHVHEVSNTDAYHALVGRIPLAIHLQNYRMWCPGQDWFYKKQEEQCSLSIGWKCVVNAYTRRCNDRHPSHLFRSLLECNKRRLLVGRGVHFIAGSEYMRDAAIEYGRIPDDQISVVSNAIDGTPFEGAGKRPDIGERLEPGYVLYVGRIAESKGIRYLLEAFALLGEERPQLVIAGDGYHRSVIEQDIHDLDLKSDVIMAGWQSGPELVWLYKNCGVVVVPSIWAEVFGNVGLEAMAARKPVVAFDVGGISQWLTDGETGYLVSSKNIDALADRINELLAIPLLADKMGENGFQHFRNRFTVQKQARVLVDAYQRVIA